MRIPQHLIRLALAFLAFSASGCDPGYQYQPVDPQGNPLSQWSEVIDGVRFSVKPYSTLIGSGSASRSLEITNKSDKKVVVLGGQLLSKGRAIEAIIDDSPEGRTGRTVSPGDTKAVYLSWEFGDVVHHRPAHEVLGPDITWVWQVRIGEGEHTLRVPMQRQQG
jgi:hypothetical protein